MAFDLVLSGATIVDPSQQKNEKGDVGIRNGKIAAVSDRLETGAHTTIDVTGRYLTPGWIDLHAHVYAGATTFGIKADALCLATGVTTIVDAGSPGWTNLRGFLEYIIEPSRTEVLTFVHISSIGLLNSMRGEMEDIKNADPERTARVISMWPQHCVGVKVRQGAFQVGSHGVEPLRRAIEAAEMVGTRVMVHIDKGVALPSILELLRPGDIVTHCYQGKGDHIIGDDDRVIPEVYDARNRGVYFDLGHGAGSFHYGIAKRAVELGFLSDVISTDLHVYSLKSPVHSLPETASKLLNMGLDFEEIVRQTTVNPAGVLNRSDDIGTLKEGTVADIAVFGLEEGRYTFTDAHGRQETGGSMITPHLTVRDGQVYYPDDLKGEVAETERRAEEMVGITGVPYGAIRDIRKVR